METNYAILAKGKQHQEALQELVRAIDVFRELHPAEWVRIQSRCNHIAECIGKAMWNAKVSLKENNLLEKKCTT